MQSTEVGYAPENPGAAPKRMGWSVGVKRAMDISVGTVLALAAVPLIALLALLSAITLRAWPFFVHHRVGRYGRPFRLVKVRTLPPQVSPYADKYAIQSLELPRWARFARRHKLDELPQLFLVPFGRMSLVGPRPEMRSLHDQFDRTFAEDRTSVRPGCTGLWQISDQCHRLIGEGAEYDKYYMRHQSLRLDLWILLQTVRTLLGGRVVALGEMPGWVAAPALRPVPSSPMDLEPMALEA